MRILQKRVKAKDCLRKDQITVPQYQKYIKDCFHQYYNEETEYTADLPGTEMEWGKY